MERQTEIWLPQPSALSRAALLISEGGVVAFPTDTVYGLCCDIFNVSAIQRIYQIKGRPAKMPLIAMFAEPEQWSLVAASLPAGARALMDRWWPGPLTLIAPARPDLPPTVLGGGATIGMRIPDHPVALELLRLCKRPLATTSANRSGAPAACTADEVLVQLNGDIDLVLDAGHCPNGQASTILDCTQTPPAILREGPVTRADLGL